MPPKKTPHPKEERSMSVPELTPDKLRACCDPSVFTFDSTADLPLSDEVIGQRRAVQAIQFGLNMTSPGYNIFVTGIEGTGKTTIVQDIVGAHVRSLPTPPDWCMVNNFQDEYRPRAVSLPSGKAGLFAKQIQRLIDGLKDQLPQAFEESSFILRKEAAEQQFVLREQTLFQALEASAGQRRVAIHKTSTGIQPIALKDGQPLTRDAFEALPESERHAIEAALEGMRGEAEEAVRELRKIRQAANRELEKIYAQVARLVVRDRLALIREEYEEWPQVIDFLEALQEDVVENLGLFLHPDHDEEEEGGETPPQLSLRRYLINVLVDRKNMSGAPLVFEPNPTYHNLFGWIDKRAVMGALETDFSMVQAGSLLQANGGFLIMEIEPLLMNALVWEALKRALVNKRLYIEDAPGSSPATASLRPNPIDLEVKVILIGGYEPFELLQNYDGKFNKIFKVRADFDHEVPRTDETIQQYARFISRVCREEQLLHFTPSGVAAIVEFGEKSVAHQARLSLRFGPIVGLIKEAEYWAREEQHLLVEDRHVYRAFDAYHFRYNLFEEKLQLACLEGSILVDVAGAVIGQVNALVVHQMGDFSFGRPSRITAEIFMGQQGVINIEREAKLSGNTHDKGVLIISGYLGRTFARTQPLTLSASITFEQSYGEVDGDSASSTELYAILSSLAEVPIRQGIAVTGSVNQKGEIQAIGGINQKIEGFFDLCKMRGLNGGQGVVIPGSNIQNLMLKKEVIDAVAAGHFHIYAVTAISEGIEILTGVPAGTPDRKGRFPEGTLFHKVQQRLETFFEQTLKWRAVTSGP
jgi:predicted ATP-dependent protease